MLLATRKPLGKWLFNPISDHEVADGDVLMVMTTPQGRTALERLLQGAV